jgi:hypothetical protein
MDIYLDKRAVKQIRLSASDAVEEGDNETLREDIHEVFTDEQIEEIERRIDSADFFDFLSEILDEWSGEEIRMRTPRPRPRARMTSRSPR